MFRKIVCFVITLIAFAVLFQSCKSTKVITVPVEDMISYNTQIKPLMVRSCAPCHFPDGGKMKFFHTYAVTKEWSDDILKRVVLDPEQDGFMPFKSKKPAFSEDEIQLFKDWIAQGKGQ